MNSFSYGQNWPSERWYDGRVVLESGDTLRGLLKYDLQKDLVQYAVKNDQPEAFTARKVLFFEIYDDNTHRYRRFFALPYVSSPGYKAPIFFELLEEGKLTLLTREFLEYRFYNSMYGSTGRYVLSYKYFFIKENGDIKEFDGNKVDLMSMMGNKSDEVDKFMRHNRLRLDDKDDFARVVDYYNSLFGG